MRKPTSVRQTVERYRDMVFRIAFAYVRNAADADDVAQNVFVKLIRLNKTFDSDDHLRHWLVRVTVNECRSLFRSPWRRIEDIERYAESLAMPTPEHIDLLVSVMRLPERYRIPLVLYYYGEFSTDEVADILRIPAPTVRTRLARGRAKLKTLLEAETHDAQQAPRSDVLHAGIR